MLLISLMTMIWLSMYTLISIVNTFNYSALCIVCLCDALGVALSVQHEGLHSTGIPCGVCVLWTPLVESVTPDVLYTIKITEMFVAI